jgi:tetratricopeptide (TPR) repeat protein
MENPLENRFFHDSCLLLIFGFVLLAWLPRPATAVEDPRDGVEFWKHLYGEVTAAGDARVSRAQDIFQRLLDVTGGRNGVVPRLLVVKSKREPYAISLPDGWIILSIGALDLCDREPGRADVCLAFVLGHEIAHQLHDDYWHLRFFQAMDLAEDMDPSAPEVRREAREIAQTTQQVLAKELRADEEGIAYAAMAGFDVRSVTDPTGDDNFFENWARSVDPEYMPGRHRDPSHPSPAVRAETIRARLRQVVDQTDYFRLGQLFDQTGCHNEAIAAYDRFLRFFPSREVYHNLAVAHHRLALATHAQWQPGRPAIPFKLSFVSDNRTRADAFVSRGDGGTFEQRFKQHLAKAIQFYETALERDSSYLLAYAGLGGAYMLNNEPYAAIKVLLDGLKLAPDEARLLNNLGVAFDMAELPHKAKEQLRRAIATEPAEDAPYFNLAQIIQREGNLDQAQAAWTAYRARNRDGTWDWMIPETATDSDREDRRVDEPSFSPESVLGVEVETRPEMLPEAWGQPFRERSMPLDGRTLTLAHYTPGITLIRLNGVVALIAVDEDFKGLSARGLQVGDTSSRVRELYGVPDTVLSTNEGKSWLFAEPGIAIQMGDERVTGWSLAVMGAP